jgi:anti-anti-sigma factor
MDIKDTEVGGLLVVEPIGGIDSTNADEFTAHVIGAVNARQCNLVIDFQKVKYISSAGFRSLLIVGKSIQSAKRKLVLCGMGPEVRRVFEIATFNELFVICASREDATQQAV